MKAKKSLGQHFLKSDKALETIRDEADPTGLDIILEIGPGYGTLTEVLLTFAGKVVAIEKDDGLYEFLKEKFTKEIANNRLDLIHGDILEFNPELLSFYHDFVYKIVANIPYNITGAILEKFLSADFQPERMVLLVQKEVAERIVARDKKESILSISVKAYGTPTYIERVLAGSFVPAPKVDSAIISITDISKQFFDGFSEKAFFDLLHVGFKSKRKKLSSNLSSYGKEKVHIVFQHLHLDENIRAEDVDVKTWKAIALQLLH